MPTVKQLTLQISRFDSLLKDWKWDFAVKSTPTTVEWRFSTIAGGGWITDTDGYLAYPVPMQPGSFITFYGQAPSGRVYRCSGMVDPVNESRQNYQIEPNVAAGTATTQSTAGHERTGMTGSGTVSAGAEGGISIPYLADSKVNANVTGTVVLPLNKNTTQTQLTTVVPTDAVVSIRAKRWLSDFPMVEELNQSSTLNKAV